MEIETNTTYGFLNIDAISDFLNEIRRIRGVGFDDITLTKIARDYAMNPTGYKIKVLKGYKIKISNVTTAMDAIYKTNTTTVKGENNMRGTETVLFYKNTHREAIVKAYDKKVTDLKLADSNYKKFVDAQDLINSMIDTTKFVKVNYLDKFEKLSDETKDNLKKALDKKNSDLNKLEALINEVLARLADTTTKEEADEVLTTYNIIGEDGKIK